MYMQFVFLQFIYNLIARFTQMQLKINVRGGFTLYFC